MKKIFLLLLLINTSHIFSMDTSINYYQLFEACFCEDLEGIDAFIKSHPTFDINYRDSNGATACLEAAVSGKWDVVWHLIRYGADIMIKDNYGQSIFSHAVHKIVTLYAFKNLLTMYKLEQINNLCKTMSFDRNGSYQIRRPVNWDSIKDIESVDQEGKTSLHIACIYKHIPMIVDLLKRGACLEIKDKLNNTSYDYLYSELGDTPQLFVVREALNNGSYVALVCDILEKNGIVSDVALYIKKLYIQPKVEDDFFSTPEACIWKPVCIDACKLDGIKETNRDRCLTHILLLPQNKKTELNIKLALADK